MKKFINEFKQFISRGNVLDLAVAVIIGGAFGKIVTSLVNDVVMPLVTAVMGANSLSELTITIRKAVIEDGEVIKAALTVNWGNFVQNIIDFLIIALVVFMFIKLVTAAKKFGEEAGKKAKEVIEGARAAEAKAEDAQEEAVADAALAEEEITTRQLLEEIRDILKEKQ